MTDIPIFLWHALLGGIGVAVLAGPLGAFVVWRKMAYFGETLSHGALLGIALSLLWDWPVLLGILLVSMLISAWLFFLESRMALANDTLLGILSHTALAAGLIAVVGLKNTPWNVLGYLYGDILALGRHDLLVLYVVGIVILGVFACIWRPLLSLTVDVDLAAIEGVPVRRVRAIYTVLLAVAVALGIQIVGVLLMTAMLILPVATARRWSRSPEQLAIFAIGVGVLSVIGGLMGSYYFDWPTGPAIVITASSGFLLGWLIPAR